MFCERSWSEVSQSPPLKKTEERGREGKREEEEKKGRDRERGN